MNRFEGKIFTDKVKGHLQPFLECNGDTYHIMNMSQTHIAAVLRKQPRTLAVFTYTITGKDDNAHVVQVEKVTSTKYGEGNWKKHFSDAAKLCGFDVPTRRHKSMVPQWLFSQTYKAQTDDRVPQQGNLRFPDHPVLPPPLNKTNLIGRELERLSEKHAEFVNRLQGKERQQKSETVELMVLVMELTRIAEPAMLNKLIESYRRGN